MVKSKDLRRQTKVRMAVFYKLCEKYYQKSCKYMRNNSTKQKGKKFQLHIEHNCMGISYQKKLESLEEKKAVHTSCKHGVRRICQLYTKGGPVAIWIIIDKTTYKDPAPKTLDELLKTVSDYASPGRICDFGHALGAHTFYTSPLRKCQKTYRKGFWLLIFYLFNVK